MELCRGAQKKYILKNKKNSFLCECDLALLWTLFFGGGGFVFLDLALSPQFSATPILKSKPEALEL